MGFSGDPIIAKIVKGLQESLEESHNKFVKFGSPEFDSNPWKAGERENIRQMNIVNPWQAGERENIRQMNIVNPWQAEEGENIRQMNIVNPWHAGEGENIRQMNIVNTWQAGEGENIRQMNTVNPWKAGEGENCRQMDILLDMGTAIAQMDDAITSLSDIGVQTLLQPISSWKVSS